MSREGRKQKGGVVFCFVVFFLMKDMAAVAVCQVVSAREVVTSGVMLDSNLGASSHTLFENLRLS